jgi:predicted neutral ceramidase superfamily lipid hydrolase
MVYFEVQIFSEIHCWSLLLPQIGFLIGFAEVRGISESAFLKGALVPVQAKKLLVLWLFVLLRQQHEVKVVLEAALQVLVLLIFQILVIHLWQSIAGHVFTTKCHRISPFLSMEILEWLLLWASIWVERVALSFKELSSHGLFGGLNTALVVDTDRHRTIEANIFEIIISTAAFGSICWVHETVELNVTNGLVFWLRDLVSLLLIQGMIIKLTECAVQFWNSVAEGALCRLRLSGPPVMMLGIE